LIGSINEDPEMLSGMIGGGSDGHSCQFEGKLEAVHKKALLNETRFIYEYKYKLCYGV
jgi:hypothetical protein